MSNGPMEVISPFVLRAMACDIEEMQSPQAWADRCRAAAAEIERLRAALQSVMVGGNHLACVIGPNHLLHTASYEDALKHYGPGDIYDVWCCWKNIMKARAALGEKV